ncbi:MAG: FKBP-type peptidyl-prolyl cis-trans isomerase, partial [Prevotella sp.]|nr:FKBP-type peptidyl-prolyl cis-trans isomerase [Prevotella sp.]
MKRIAYFFLPLALALLSLSACKEDDNTVEEFPNWQVRNETYFTQAYQQALTASATNPNVKVLH